MKGGYVVTKNYMSYKEVEKPDNNGLANFQEYIDEIQILLKKMTVVSEIPTNKPITSHRRIFGPVITFFKKITRKFLKWYAEPIVRQQTEFNNVVTPSIGKITEISNFLINNAEETNKIIELHEQVSRNLDDKIIELQEQVSRKLDELANEIIVIDNKNKKLTLENDSFKDIVLKEMEFLNLKFKKIEELDVFNALEIDHLNSYSQAGEDGILDYVIRVLRIPYSEVTYVDLGANHAKNLSNTYSFYCKGAKGVLVEANPHLVPELKFYRHRDIVLNNCVDVKTGEERTLYIMNSDGLSTVDTESVANVCKINSELKVIEEIQLKTISLNEIIQSYLGKAPTILSIDLEGIDVNVLQSIDYEKYRPILIVVETIEYDTKLAYNTKSEEISRIMKINNYDEYAFTGINSIFIDREYLNDWEEKSIEH